MKLSFEDIQPFVLHWEGSEYTDDPLDAGGATKWGIDMRSLKDQARDADTARFFKSIGILLPVNKSSIQVLTVEQANAVYRRMYWNPLLDFGFQPLTRCVMYDTAVNCGQKRAVICLQRHLGVGDDGIIGPVTREAYTGKVDFELAMGVISQRELFYRSIVKNRPTQQRFIRGWLNRCGALREWVKEHR